MKLPVVSIEGRRRRLVLISILIIVLLLAGLGLSSVKRKKQECFDNARICLSYDKSWQKADLATGNLDQYIHVRLSHDSPKGELQVTAQDGSANITDKSFQDSVVAKLGESLDDFKLDKAETAQINGIDTAQFIYEYSYRNKDGAKVSNRQQLVILPTQNKVYYVTIQAEPQHFSSVMHSAQSIIDSIKITAK